MTANATTLSSVSPTAASVQVPAFYQTIVIENSSGGPVYVRTDGVTAVASAAGTECVPTGATLAFPNQQPLPNSHVSNPLLPLANNAGWTSQLAVVGGVSTNPFYASNYGTYVSVIGGTGASGPVTVSLQ